MHELLGTSIKFNRGKGVVLDAVVTGSENPVEGESPKLHLVFADPDKLHLFQGAQWAQAFEPVFSVPHSADSGHDYGWSLAPDDEAIDSRDRALAGLRLALGYATEEIERLRSEVSSTPAPLQDPTGADLDAVAAEQQAAQATDPKPNGKSKRVPKPAQVADAAQ